MLTVQHTLIRINIHKCFWGHQINQSVRNIDLGDYDPNYHQMPSTVVASDHFLCIFQPAWKIYLTCLFVNKPGWLRKSEIQALTSLSYYVFLDVIRSQYLNCEICSFHEFFWNIFARCWFARSFCSHGRVVERLDLVSKFRASCPSLSSTN